MAEMIWVHVAYTKELPNGSEKTTFVKVERPLSDLTKDWSTMAENGWGPVHSAFSVQGDAEDAITSWLTDITKESKGFWKDKKQFYMVYRQGLNDHVGQAVDSNYPRSLSAFKKILFLSADDVEGEIYVLGSFVVQTQKQINSLVSGSAHHIPDECEVKPTPKLDPLGNPHFIAFPSWKKSPSEYKRILGQSNVTRAAEMGDAQGVLIQTDVGDYLYKPLDKTQRTAAQRVAFSALEKMYGGYSTHFNASRNAEAQKKERNIPQYVLEKAEYFEKEKGYPTDYAFAMAWSIWCKYKDPTSKHCKKDTNQYLKRRKR